VTNSKADQGTLICTYQQSELKQAMFAQMAMDTQDYKVNSKSKAIYHFLYITKSIQEHVIF